MGLGLEVETSTAEERPLELGFSRSDSKSLLRHLAAVRARDATNELVRILTHINIDIAPLTRFVSHNEEPFESFFARDPSGERRRYWETAHAEREAAWQSPGDLLSVLDALLDKLRGLPDSASEPVVSESYFHDGIFVHDLIDLREIIRWAQTRQIPFVRLVTC